jgi:polar amino acid transport system ATP-binding protein
LEVRKLQVSQGGKTIISDFDLRLARNACVAVVGYSGCGKSTLLKSLVGLVASGGGNAWLDGEPFIKEGRVQVQPWALRRQLTLVPQHAGLQPHHTLSDNIALTAMTVLEIPRSAALARVQAVAEELGLTEHLNAYPGRVSGGQAQRAHLARALVLEPAALLLDEVTSSADPRTSEDICAALQHIRRTRLISVLLVSHDFSVVRRLADQVVFLHEGRNFDETSGKNFPSGFSTLEARTFTAETHP